MEQFTRAYPSLFSSFLSAQIVSSSCIRIKAHAHNWLRHTQACLQSRYALTHAVSFLQYRIKLPLPQFKCVEHTGNTLRTSTCRRYSDTSTYNCAAPLPDKDRRIRFSIYYEKWLVSIEQGWRDVLASCGRVTSRTFASSHRSKDRLWGLLMAWPFYLIVICIRWMSLGQDGIEGRILVNELQVIYIHHSAVT